MFTSRNSFPYVAKPCQRVEWALVCQSERKTGDVTEEHASIYLLP